MLGGAPVKTCPRCAEQNQDEAIRCRSCGDALAGGATDLPPPPPRPDEEPLQYTHSGRRHLLGYGRDFFGIWDRTRSIGPVSRYPRTDEGWRAAWLAFSELEPESAEVGMGPAPVAPSTGEPPVAPPTPRRVSPAWWLLPIFMGWLGGLIAWIVNRDVEPDRARAMLVTGIAISVAVFLLVILRAPATAP